MSELKRCPFCGEIPICGVEFYESRVAEVKIAAVVKCNGCGVGKRVIFKATEPTTLVPFWDYEKAFAAVVEQWNKRADTKD